MDIVPYFGLSVTNKPYDFKNKRQAIGNYIDYMLARTMKMFAYDGLPESIPVNALETYTQMNGLVCVFEHEGKLYASFGGWGGEPNAYYIPTKFVVANPYLNVFKTFTVGEDCVIVKNDSLYKGLRDMFRKYATHLATNDVSLQIASISSRMISIIEASNDKAEQSARKYIEDIERGDLSVVTSPAFVEGIRTQPYMQTSQSDTISALIEYQQYMKASWFNELGIQSNYNMKRESINSNEAQLNEDALFPLVDDMLACRQEGWDEVNKMFGTNVSVKLSSAWEDNALEKELAQEEMEAAAEISDKSETTEGGDEIESETGVPEDDVE